MNEYRNIYTDKFTEGNRKLDRCLEILRKQFPDMEFIKTKEGGIADKEISIDLKAVWDGGEENWACKFREPNYKSKFDDITVEYLNGNGTNGDWFRFMNGSVHKYVYGWANGEIEFFVINISKLMNCSNWSREIRNNKWGNASFKAVTIQNLKDIGAIDYYYNSELSKSELNKEPSTHKEVEEVRKV